MGELPYLTEWVDYYLAIGVSKIYLYDNSDNYETDDWYTEHYQQQQHWDKKHFPRPIHRPGPKQQMPVYKECGRRVKRLQHTYVMFLDIDEYVVLKRRHHNNNIVDFAVEYLPPSPSHNDSSNNSSILNNIDPNSVGAIGIQWSVFGTSGRHNSDDETLSFPVTYRFQCKIRTKQFITETYIKSLIRVKDLMPNGIDDPHFFKWALRNRKRTIGTNGVVMESSVSPVIHNDDDDVDVDDTDDDDDNTTTATVAVIHHYHFRSYDEFYLRKVTRGDVFFGNVSTNVMENSRLGMESPNTVIPYGEVYDPSVWNILKQSYPHRYMKYEQQQQGSLNDDDDDKEVTMKCTSMIPKIIHVFVVDNNSNNDNDNNAAVATDAVTIDAVTEWRQVADGVDNHQKEKKKKKKKNDNNNGWKVMVWDISNINNLFTIIQTEFLDDNDINDDHKNDVSSKISKSMIQATMQKVINTLNSNSNHNMMTMLKDLVRYYVIQKYGGIIVTNDIVPTKQQRSLEPLRAFGPVFVICEDDSSDDDDKAEADIDDGHIKNKIKTATAAATANTISSARMMKSRKKCRRISDKVMGSIPNHPILNDVITDMITIIQNMNNNKNKNDVNGSTSLLSSSSRTVNDDEDDGDDSWWTKRLLINKSKDDDVTILRVFTFFPSCHEKTKKNQMQKQQEMNNNNISDKNDDDDECVTEIITSNDFVFGMRYRERDRRNH
jgi:Glycosyl transferase family 2